MDGGGGGGGGVFGIFATTFITLQYSVLSFAINPGLIYRTCPTSAAVAYDNVAVDTSVAV